MEKPNFIFFMTDSWDGRALGCMGHPAMQRATPNADALAKRGALLSNTYTTHPICCPARANFWSGQYTPHCESWNNNKGLEPNTPTLKDYLEKAGYRFGSSVGGFGKHDYRSGDHSQQARVSSWTNPANLPVDTKYMPEYPKIVESDDVRVEQEDWENSDKSIDFIRDCAKSRQPFFLYLGLFRPHPSFITNRHYLKNIDTDKVTIPPLDKQDHPVMTFQRRNKDWRFGFDDELVRKVRSIYYAMCSEADAILGQIVREADRLGLSDNTYIIFTSDHGENAMEHRQYFKMNHYESSARIPLIIAGPGIPHGLEINNIASLIDLFPTIMEMAKAPCPQDRDGESLLPLLTGKTIQSRNNAFGCFTDTTLNTTSWMYREGDWKYIAYPGYIPQLFNLKNDPDEIDNVFSSYPDVVTELDAKLREICDYEEAHGRCQAYNKKSFKKWRNDVKENGISMHEYGMNKDCATYLEAMGNIYYGFGHEHDKMLDEWLDSKQA